MRAHTQPQSLEFSSSQTMSPLFCGLSLAAGDDWSVNHFPTAPHCVLLCVSEVVKRGLEERQEGVCLTCMIISEEEVMEFGHIYGLKDLPLELLPMRNHARFIIIPSNLLGHV